MVYKFFDKKSKGCGVNTHANNKTKPNQRTLHLATHQLAEELHKPIIKKLKKEMFIEGSKTIFGGADLADMQWIRKFFKTFRSFLRVIDIFSKYAWVIPLKDKKGITITNAFQKILKKSNRKPNKIWVEKGSKFYNIYFKKWLKDNNIEMYLILNERKSVVAEKCIRTLKTTNLQIHDFSIKKCLYR